MGRYRRAAIVAVLFVALVLLLSASFYRPSAPPHFLSYAEDSYKITFYSGNLSATVTKDMPRVVFGHKNPVVSPEFSVTCQKLYLFNDTNGDGVFSRSEAVYTCYLDSHHIQWTISKVEFGNYSGGGEYAEMSMHGNASLYASTDDVPTIPVVSNWAAVTFHYRISERNISHSNVLGAYVVAGRTEMNMSFSLTLLKRVPAQGLVLEQDLHGGGSTNMLLLREATGAGGTRLEKVSGGLDESSIGANFTHRFLQTTGPCQDVYMAKENGVVQAFYHFSSVPMAASGAAIVPIRMNSSYYTDGAGMLLDQALFAQNATSLAEESSLGIDERGFNLTVTDWFSEHLSMLMLVSGTIAAAILLAALVAMYRRYRKDEQGGQSEAPKDPRSG